MNRLFSQGTFLSSVSPLFLEWKLCNPALETKEMLNPEPFPNLMHARVHAIRKIPVKYQCNQLRFWQGFSSWKDDTKKWPRHCRLCHKGNTEQRASEHPTGRSLEQKCLEVTAACAHEEQQRGAPCEEVWGEPVHTRPQGSEGNTNTMLNLKEIQLLEKAERFSSWRTANNCATCKGTPASRRKNCYSAAVWVTFKHYIPSDKRQIFGGKSVSQRAVWHTQGHGFNAQS